MGIDTLHRLSPCKSIPPRTFSGSLNIVSSKRVAHWPSCSKDVRWKSTSEQTSSRKMISWNNCEVSKRFEDSRDLSYLFSIKKTNVSLCQPYCRILGYISLSEIFQLLFANASQKRAFAVDGISRKSSIVARQNSWQRQSVSHYTRRHARECHLRRDEKLGDFLAIVHRRDAQQSPISLCLHLSTHYLIKL